MGFAAMLANGTNLQHFVHYQQRFGLDEFQFDF
jgi:hypothetical protein